MAKLERHLQGDFLGLLRLIENGIMKGSVSARLEDQSNFETGDVKVAVRVFERYSALGQNRVSLSVTLIGQGGNLFVSGITSGGSQAVFFKINTFGEGAFLEKLGGLLDRFGR